MQFVMNVDYLFLFYDILYWWQRVAAIKIFHLVSGRSQSIQYSCRL